MAYNEDEFLMLSGIQHFAFCRRQWALIHIEQQWAENDRTADGRLMHTRAHDATLRESRGDLLIARGIRIFSPTLGVSGACDVLEFRRAACGAALDGREGLWQPYPVEYKRSGHNLRAGDHLQLCGQAMCLEEMLCCDIPKGALYSGETRHRTEVEFTKELRAGVRDAVLEMHGMYKRGYTPKVRPTKSCNACSLKEICLPKLLRGGSAAAYIERAAGE